MYSSSHNTPNGARSAPRTPRTPHRPATIAELAERALDNLWDENRELKHYLRVAERYRREGKALADQGDLEGAFIEFARAATLVLEKLPTHRDYQRLLKPEQRHNLGLNGQDILDSLSELKPQLVERYEQWRLAHETHPQQDLPRPPSPRRAAPPERRRAANSHELEKELAALYIDVDRREREQAEQRREQAQREAAQEELEAWKRQREALQRRDDEEVDVGRTSRVAGPRSAPHNSVGNAGPDYTFSRPVQQANGYDYDRGPSRTAQEDPRRTYDARRAEDGRRMEEAQRAKEAKRAQEARRAEEAKRAEDARRHEAQQEEMRRREQEIMRRRAEERLKQEQESIARRQQEAEYTAHFARSDLGGSSAAPSYPVSVGLYQHQPARTPSPQYPVSVASTMRAPKAVKSRPPSFLDQYATYEAPLIMPLESPTKYESDSTDSESTQGDDRGPRNKQAADRTPTRAPARSPLYPPPITTTSPPPRDTRILYPNLMTQHQKLQGYVPSLHSMFMPPPSSAPSAAQSSLLFEAQANSARGLYSQEMLPPPSAPAGYSYGPRHPPPAQYYAGPSRAPPPVPPPPTLAPPQPERIMRASSSEDVPELRTVNLPRDCLPRFVAIAALNTAQNRETCGLLLGKDKGSKYVVTTLLIPRQHATSDTCTMDEEELVLQFTEERSLITLGWIHTHPSQSCFMSSVDLHTHSGFQRMLPESFAVVCAPKVEPSFGIFRLTAPRGLNIILDCTAKEAFHPHPPEPIYTDADKGHVQMKDAPLEIVDLRDL